MVHKMAQTNGKNRCRNATNEGHILNFRRASSVQARIDRKYAAYPKGVHLVESLCYKKEIELYTNC